MNNYSWYNAVMIPVLILAMSAVTHFIHFGKPASVVFDEVFYGNFASSYWQGSYFFDLHPPFVKLLFAFVGKIFNLDQFTVDWSSIGNSIPISVIGLRILPMIAGLLLPIIVYAICRRLEFSKSASFVGASLVILENSLTVQSRYILPDIIMLFVGFSAILFYLEYIKRLGLSRWSWSFAISTISAGLALTIKWTGLTFLFLIIVMEVYRLYCDSTKIKVLLKKISIFTLKYLVISAVIYTSLFFIHFSILPNSGPGDVFMSQRFQKTLIGNSNYNDPNLVPSNFVEKITELNRVMFTSSSGMTATHPNSSKWYTWPIMQRSVFYWQDNATSTDSQHSYIYLLGNPFIYWLGTISVIMLILVSIFKLIIRKKLSIDPETSKVMIFITIGYLANLLPFMLIGRVMFLYHYETALIFSIMAVAFLVDIMVPKKKVIAIVLILAIALSAFIYWSPLTYGTPLTDLQMKSRMWLTTWR
jgi:dolichyl-phosphate-mannose-protein mannosyltransferase